MVNTNFLFFVDSFCLSSSQLRIYTLRRRKKKGATWNPFCPVFRILGKTGSQKGSLHVQEPTKFPYITKNDSKEPKTF